jgi:hypothetical protein
MLVIAHCLVRTLPSIDDYEPVYFPQPLSTLGNYVFVLMAIIILGFPASRGQTTGHYIFGMQMVNSQTEEKCGFQTVFVKYAIQWTALTLFGAPQVLYYFYDFCDFVALLEYGATFTDNILGVRVVIREK